MPLKFIWDRPCTLIVYKINRFNSKQDPGSRKPAFKVLSCATSASNIDSNRAEVINQPNQNKIQTNPQNGTVNYSEASIDNNSDTQ